MAYDTTMAAIPHRKYASLVGACLHDTGRSFPGGGAARLHATALSIWEMRLKLDARNRPEARETSIDPNTVLGVLRGQEEGLPLLTADRQLADHPLSITVKGRV